MSDLVNEEITVKTNLVQTEITKLGLGPRGLKHGDIIFSFQINIKLELVIMYFIFYHIIMPDCCFDATTLHIL